MKKNQTVQRFPSIIYDRASNKQQLNSFVTIIVIIPTSEHRKIETTKVQKSGTENVGEAQCVKILGL